MPARWLANPSLKVGNRVLCITLQTGCWNTLHSYYCLLNHFIRFHQNKRRIKNQQTRKTSPNTLQWERWNNPCKALHLFHQRQLGHCLWRRQTWQKTAPTVRKPRRRFSTRPLSRVYPCPQKKTLCWMPLSQNDYTPQQMPWKTQSLNKDYTKLLLTT